MSTVISFIFILERKQYLLPELVTNGFSPAGYMGVIYLSKGYLFMWSNRLVGSFRACLTRLAATAMTGIICIHTGTTQGV